MIKSAEDNNKRKANWIEKKIKEVLPKEEDLKDISKVALAHNVVMITDQLQEITDERDIIAKENDRLYEEVNNLKIIIENLKS